MALFYSGFVMFVLLWMSWRGLGLVVVVFFSVVWFDFFFRIGVNTVLIDGTYLEFDNGFFKFNIVILLRS